MKNKEYIMCKNCLMHSGIPNITINEEGICSDCVDYEQEKQEISREELKKYEKQMEELVKSVKKRNNSYDALVLFSGGKDSTKLLEIAKETYGLKTLAFSMLLPIGKKQAVQNMVDVTTNMNIDLMRVSINEKTYKTYMNYALKNSDKYDMGEYVGCAACSFLFRWYAYRLAMDMGIPIILDGRDKWQCGGILFETGEEVKKKAENGEKPFGRLHDLFHDAAHFEGLDSYLDYDFKELKDKKFPALIAPFTFLEYHTLDSLESIEKMGLDKNNFETMYTNCDGVYLFDYIALKKYGCTSYHKGYSHGLRQNIPTITQLKVDGREEEGLNRDDTIRVLDEYRQILYYFSEHNLTEETLTEEHIRQIKKMTPMSMQIYGEEGVNIFIQRFTKLVSFANYFNLDLKEDFVS